MSSPSVSCGRIDDNVFFELEEIDGEKYLNTHDLFKIREDGSLYCLGRANRFFVNEEGVRFDAGLIERAVSAQKGIRGCGLVPEYNKMIHDTEPALYVETDNPCVGGYRSVRNALEQVYIKDGMIDRNELPVRCVLMDKLPRTMTGKVDTNKISKSEGDLDGSTYNVEGIYEDGKLKEIELIPGGGQLFGVRGLGCDFF